MKYDNNINKQIITMNNAEKVFGFLLEMLSYKDSSNFHMVQDADYDAAYSIKIEKMNYTVIGIKIYNERDERLILKNHLKYWNENKVPFSILILPDEIRIYNNFTIGKNKLLYTSKQLKDNIIELFSEKNILNGILWEKIHSSFNKKDRVDAFLLNNLRNTITNLFNNYGMELEDAYNFLAQCIFIKYMEDRQMLTESVFVDFGVKNFNQLLELADVTLIKKLFVWLKERFNGDLFETDYINWPTNEQISVIKSFFEAEEIYADGTIQYTLIKYDFSKIPIELISNIYETFFNLGDNLLNKKYSSKNGAYYTPYYLAEFMNDRCIEKYQWKYAPVVLDPACGSGVFLVGAFRRIVDHIKKESGEVETDELSKILQNNIFGIDKNLKALKLACFSLYIALLEYLMPKDIQKNKFHFPHLIGQTLICGDFFDGELCVKDIKADIIIGNPPWVSDKNGKHNTYCKENNIPISDGQTAQAFIAKAQDFVQNDGIVSLIVTNSIFTNENARAFRKYLLKYFQISEVFNLYKVRDSLFSHASAPCSIVTYKCKKEVVYKFQYYTFTPNLLSETFYKIVYDKTNIINIKNTVILKKDFIWRILNNGDEYDVRVINKIKSFPAIRDLNFKYFRGYAVGTKNLKRRPEYLTYKGGNLREGYHPYLINYSKLNQMVNDKFERPREIEGYLCKNKILIKRTQNEKLAGAAFCEKPVIFTDDYHCLYDLSNERSEDLKLIEAFINSKIFGYYRFFVSKISNSIKPEITKDDVLSFPIPQDIYKQDRETILDGIIRIEELLKRRFEKDIFEDYELQEIDHKIDKVREEIDKIIYKAYNFDELEQAVIEYAFKYVIGKDKVSNVYIEQYCEKDIYNQYIEYVEKYFNTFLDRSEFTLKCDNVYSQNLFTIITFKIRPLIKEQKDMDHDELLEKIVDVLGVSSIENINSEMMIKNRLSGFLENGFFVVKEKELKNWTLMGAIKDVEYFSKIILQENEGAIYEE